MPFNVDRLLAILGVVLAIAGLIPQFALPPRLEEGMMLAGLLFVIAAYFSHLYWWEHVQPSFTHLELDKTVSFQRNSTDWVAKVDTVIKSKANHSGLTQLWFRHFAPKEGYQNVLIDTAPPGTTKQKAGTLEFCKDFNRPLSSGEKVTVKVSYEVHNAFTESQESVTHRIGTKTKMLKLVTCSPLSAQS
jgi:hypothetical protein